MCPDRVNKLSFIDIVDETLKTIIWHGASRESSD